MQQMLLLTIAVKYSKVWYNVGVAMLKTHNRSQPLFPTLEYNLFNFVKETLFSQIYVDAHW
jgi:hypothetical protein